MRYSFLRDILSQPMMLEPLTASANIPILRGLLMGAVMEDEKSESVTMQTIEVTGQQSNTHKINVVKLEGVMTREDGECSYGTKNIAKFLKQGDSTPNVIGSILMIDSGGGAANSVQVLADAITSLTKPCIAFVDGMMCSAAMFAGSYCEYIVASSEDDRIGCIGTMIEIMDYPKSVNLANGMIYLRLYADSSTEKNLEYENALTGNVELLKTNLLNPINEKFVNAVKKNRKSCKEEQLHGLTYFAKDAVGTLIDEVGTFQRAVDKIVELSSQNNTPISENNTNQKMDLQLPNLQMIPSLSSIDESDGTVSLTAQQLTDIEAAMTEHDASLSEAKSQLEAANATITTLKDLVASKDARIKELEYVIEDDNSDAAETQYHNGAHLPEQQSDNIDPLDYCLNHIKDNPY